MLIELDREMEEAAASLGARGATIFRRIILPNLLPAILSGAALASPARSASSARSSSSPATSRSRPQLASVYIFRQIETDDPGRGRVSVVLLLLSLVVLLGISPARAGGRADDR